MLTRTTALDMKRTDTAHLMQQFDSDRSVAEGVAASFLVNRLDAA